MPDEFDEIAERLYKRLEGKIGDCSTEACRKTKAEAETAYKKYFEDGDLKSLGKLDELNKGIGSLLEAIEKAGKEPGECLSCHYKGGDAPKRAGKCANGCAYYNEHEKAMGVKKCLVCGENIAWDTV